MYLIGLTGKARAGKDTVANYLAMEYGFITSSFAGPLKRAAVEMFGLTEDERGEACKEVVLDYWGISPRTMYQKLGTEGGRMVFGDDLWLKRWGKFYAEFGSKAHVVVTDCRFDNEAGLIRARNGIVVHVRNDRGNSLAAAARAHASEAGVEMLDTDWVIDNSSSFEHLYASIDNLMKHLAHTDEVLP